MVDPQRSQLLDDRIEERVVRPAGIEPLLRRAQRVKAEPEDVLIRRAPARARIAERRGEAMSDSVRTEGLKAWRHDQVRKGCSVEPTGFWTGTSVRGPT